MGTFNCATVDLTAATTVFDPATLPTCLPNCGILYDVNGACAAQGVANIEGVCAPGVCQPAELGSIQGWYTSFCANQAQTQPTTTGKAGTGNSNNNNGGGGGGDWLSNHYQWVIFLVIMVVGIVGIWVGACVWRKRYLRKKDRQYALGTNLAHATESGRVVPNSSNAGSLHVPGAGMFTPAPISSAGVYNEKPKKEKKKWIVRERT
ncbi:hypothetical protein OQA88_1707 [Cercophora sp. LCS_1]